MFILEFSSLEKTASKAFALELVSLWRTLLRNHENYSENQGSHWNGEKIGYWKQVKQVDLHRMLLCAKGRNIKERQFGKRDSAKWLLRLWLKDGSKTVGFRPPGLWNPPDLKEISCSFQRGKPHVSTCCFGRARSLYVPSPKLDIWPKSPFLPMTWIRFDKHCSKTGRDIQKCRTLLKSWENWLKGDDKQRLICSECHSVQPEPEHLAWMKSTVSKYLVRLWSDFDFI